jgi:hypothetical protein
MLADIRERGKINMFHRDQSRSYTSRPLAFRPFVGVQFQQYCNVIVIKM